MISGVGDKRPGVKAAVELGRRIWERRAEFKFQGTAMEPLKALLTLDRCDHYPAFLSDSADNVTAGAAGDNAYMLDMILKQGIKGVLVAHFIDGPAVAFCAAKEKGDRFDLSLGGTIDPAGSVRTVLTDAELVEVFRQGGKATAAVVKTDAVTVLILAERGPITSEAVLNSYGLSAYDYRITVVKQGYLTPEFYEVLKEYIMALTPGNCAQDLTMAEYRNVRRPMEPLDIVGDERRIAETYEAIEV